MARLLATYARAGERHRIELVPQGAYKLLVDRAGDGPMCLVAELGPGEGEPQALAVLHSGGAYLERARAGEPRLCKALDDDDLFGWQPPARAA